MKQYNINGKYLVSANTHDQAISIVKAIKAKDGNNVKHTAEYLWTWEQGNVPGSDVPKTRKELDAFYNELRKEVDRMLKAGYAMYLKTVKDSISDKWVGKRLPMTVQTKIENIAKTLHIPYEINRNDYLFETKDDADKLIKEVHRQTGITLIKTFANRISTTEFVTDSISDEVPEDVDLDFLISDELEAIDGYKKMIAKTNNPKLLSVLSHILDEETEHVEELRAAQSGVYKIDDSVKDAPDFLTPSGRKDIYMQIAMSALDNIPARMWNIKGDKISIDNNWIVLVVTDKGIVWKQETGKSIVFTDKKTLEQSLLQVLG